MLAFFGGLFIGSAIGITVMCLCFVSSEADKKISRKYKEDK